LKNLTRTKFNADFTFLAAFGDDVDLTLWDNDCLYVYGYSCENSHPLLTSCCGMKAEKLLFKPTISRINVKNNPLRFIGRIGALVK
jgi:hypothetical protein